MSSYLVALPASIPPVTKSRPIMIPVAEYDNGAPQYVYLSTEDTTGLYPGSRLLGGWDNDGNVLIVDQTPIPVDPDVAEYLQQPGNVSGVAPTTTATLNFLGHKPERAVQETPAADTLPQFAADRQPYQVTVERTFIDDDGFPQIPHGFRFSLAFAAPGTSPAARSFGVYADEACTQFLWTPGAFQEVTEDGETVWRIDCPVGQRTAEPQAWNFAMLFGAAQQGHFTLPASQQTVTRYFFEHDQRAWPGAGWIDSGQTVTGMAGTVTLVGDNSGFNVGDQVRIAGHESTVQSKWTGTGLVLDPYKAHVTGEVVEVWAS